MSKEVKRYRLEHNTPAREVEPGRDVNILRGTGMLTEADFGRAYDALLAERDALKKDAERYRWMRAVVIAEREGCTEELYDSECDRLLEAYDAAMQGEQPCSQR